MGRESRSIPTGCRYKSIKALYSGFRGAHKTQKKRAAQLINQDGIMGLKDTGKTLNRFAEHFDKLLNMLGAVD